MPSIPSQSQLTKRSKCHKLLPASTAVTIISIHSIILPSLYNNLPQPMRTSQLSGQEYMDEVLHAVNRLVPKYIKLPSTSKTCVSITSNPKFYTYFNDCIGALDGTHIAAKVPNEDTAAYRNRKGWLSQNVLVCCEFDNS